MPNAIGGHAWSRATSRLWLARRRSSSGCWVGARQLLTADEHPEAFSVPHGRTDLGEPSAHRLASSGDHLTGAVVIPAGPEAPTTVALALEPARLAILVSAMRS